MVLFWLWVGFKSVCYRTRLFFELEGIIFMSHTQESHPSGKRFAAHFAVVMSVVVLGVFAVPSPADAGIIVQDGFSGTFAGGNGAIVGRTPDTVNLAGNTYTEQQNANAAARMELDTATGNPLNSLKTGFNNSAHIQYSNSGVPTTQITLTIDTQINTLADDGSPRGVGLGFWNPLPTLYSGTEPSATTYFTGILVTPAGTLEYVLNGVSQGIFTTAPGGFSVGAFLNLSYTIDPTTSDITSLVYAGTDYTTDFTSTFPANFTPSVNAGFLGSTAANANYFGRVDNFVVELVTGPFWTSPGSSNITATSADAYATLGGTNAQVTLYWKEGTTNAPFGHTGWDGTNGPSAGLTGLVERVISNLQPETVYSYIFYATNSVISNEAWSAAGSFSSGLDYDYTMQISFTNYPYTQLPNFPALVKFNTNDSFYAGFSSTNAYDLRFTKEDGLSLLNYEIEEWNTGGTSYVWVQIEDFTNNCSIRAHWGNASATQPAYTTNGSVWTEGYEAVFHMTEKDAQDSTTNGYDGTGYDNTATADAQIGQGLTFDGTGDYVGLGAGTNPLSALVSWSLEWWHNQAADHGSGGMLSVDPYNDAGNRFICQNNAGLVYANGWKFSGGPWPADSTWHHFVLSKNGSAWTLYKDGVEWKTANSAWTMGSTEMRFARHANDANATYWKGALDEIRAASATRSSNWVWACWMNQGTNHDSFVEYGEVIKDEVIKNVTPTTFSSTNATLTATLQAPGTNYDVSVYWSTNNNLTDTDWSNDLSASNEVVDSYNDVAETNIEHDISGLIPQTDYYFTFVATNVSTNIWATPNGEFTTLSSLAAPVVDNGNGATPQAGYATLSGNLTSGGTADIYVFWGPTDGTNNLVAWAHTNLIEDFVQENSPFSTNTTNAVLYGVEYFYRCYATNAVDDGWANTTTNFLTLDPGASLVNDAATGITTDTATFNGTLGATGSVFNVLLYWGTNNEGMVASAWSHTNVIDSYTNVPSQPLTFTTNVLSPDTEYFYAFRATNLATTTLWGDPSASFTTALTPGQTPEFTSATGVAATVRLVWQDNAANETGYVLQRSTNAVSDYAVVATLASNTTSYTDGGVSASGTYYYRLAATNSSNGSGTDFTACETNAVVAARVIYADDFSGGDVTLSGLPPDVRPGGETWTANTDGDFRANGNVQGDGNDGAWLPFTIEPGRVYALSADINTTNGGTDGITLGFAENNGNAVFYDASVNGYGTLLIRQNRGAGQGQTFAGVGTAGGGTGVDTTAGSQSIKIVFDASDASAANWTMEWFVGGWSAAGPQTVAGGSYADIGYIGFSRLNTADGIIDNLELTDDGVSTLYWSNLGVSNITTNAAAAYAMLNGTNAQVTLYWKEGTTNAPFGHIGWDGTNGPSAGVTGLVERAITNLQPDTLYSYVFYGTNSDISTVAWSDAGTFSTDLSALQTPVFTSAVVSVAGITLGWQDKASNETGYVLKRSSDGISYSLLATPASNTTTYADGGLVGGTYYYRLAATNSGNGSVTVFTACQTNATVISPSADTIYFDSFTAANGTAINGRAVEVNNGVAGATYVRNNGAWTADIQSNKLRLGADNAATLDIQSAGAFTQPQMMRVSAIVEVGTTAGPGAPGSDTGNQRGIGLGFFTGTGGDATENDFRGLVLGTDERLILARDDVAGANRAGFLAEIATGINIAIPHTLSFIIDTETGDISSILLDGVEQPDVATTIFSADVNRVGVMASSQSGGTFAYFDDFTVEEYVPPSPGTVFIFR